MYEISKEFHFEAAHQLIGLPPSHPCSRMHGHSYKVIFTLRSKKTNQIGFVEDYRNLDHIRQWIDNNLDHRIINDVFPKMNPTAENIAKLLFDVFSMDFEQLVSVTVKETDKTSATYQGGRN